MLLNQNNGEANIGTKLQETKVLVGGEFYLTDFNETEKWIAITSIMKTSEMVKKLPKDMVDYLFIQLRREFAPHLSDEEVRNIEKEIDSLAKSVQKLCFKSATKMLGKGDVKEAIKQLTSIVGKEKSDIVSRLFGNSHK